MTEPWTSDHVQRVLDALASDIQITHFSKSTATSQLAAEQIGCELGQIAKSILFMVDGQPVLVIASGDQRIDDRKLAARFDVSRKRVRTATADECVAITGYLPGGVPPFGHKNDSLTRFVDRSLGRYDIVYAAAGSSTSIMPIAYERLVRLVGGEVADFAKENSADQGQA